MAVLLLIVLFVAGRASLAQQEDVSLLSLRLTVSFDAEATEIHRGSLRRLLLKTHFLCKAPGQRR